jgi:hypothetical protein
VLLTCSCGVCSETALPTTKLNTYIVLVTTYALQYTEFPVQAAALPSQAHSQRNKLTALYLRLQLVHERSKQEETTLAALQIGL